jgi:hypothetical protein
MMSTSILEQKDIEVPAKPKSKLPKVGCNIYNRFNTKNARGLAFGGAAAIIGTGRLARAHVHTTTGISVVTPELLRKIDGVKLAKQFGIEALLINSGRYWTMDEVEFLCGYIIEFDGVGMAWGGEMVGDDILDQFKHAYLPCLIQRNTKWVYYGGRPVHLLRDPGGAVWVMQEFTKDIDPTLTMDNLHEVGSKLKNLPQGWKFETKVLPEELTLDTARCDGWAAILRDELHCTYQACGYDSDTSANYVP